MRPKCLVILAILAMGGAPAAAQDVQSGHRLASMWCSGCHQVEAIPGQALRDVPPPLASVARVPSTTSMSLTVFLSTPHPTMPNFSLSRQEIADVAAYILSLRPAEPRN